jgi:hypothetical protein
MLPSTSDYGVGTPDCLISRLNGLACACPCQRFAETLTGPGARLGVIVGRWPFDAELFHILLHAGGLEALYGLDSRDELVRWVEEVLAPVGGRLFEGYRVDSGWRPDVSP